MTGLAIEMEGVEKAYRFFRLRGVTLALEPGQIMGFVGPNGAGKSTTIRILMGLAQQDRGDVRVLGRRMPEGQAEAKRDVGYFSDDMRLYARATLDWHMRFVASIYSGWDGGYAADLVSRFNLHPEQPIKSLSHGERTKAALLLDEPTTGLDPVARDEILAELTDVLIDERRAVLFSSQNTQDVEQISDQITFIDRGLVIESRDKETFLERWRRLQLDVAAGFEPPALPEVIELRGSGRVAVAVTNAYTPELASAYERAGAVVREVQRMTLEEIFVSIVMSSRKGSGT